MLVNTETWVQEWLNPAIDALDEGEPGEKRPPRDPLGLLRLMRQAARTWTPVYDTDEYRLVAIIMQFLREAIFDIPFYCLGDNEEGERTLGVVDDISGAMAALPRGMCRVPLSNSRLIL